jgi:hypothetical protein
MCWTLWKCEGFWRDREHNDIHNVAISWRRFEFYGFTRIPARSSTRIIAHGKTLQLLSDAPEQFASRRLLSIPLQYRNDYTRRQQGTIRGWNWTYHGPWEGWCSSGVVWYDQSSKLWSRVINECSHHCWWIELRYHNIRVSLSFPVVQSSSKINQGRWKLPTMSVLTRLCQIWGIITYKFKTLNRLSMGQFLMHQKLLLPLPPRLALASIIHNGPTY